MGGLCRRSHRKSSAGTVYRSLRAADIRPAAEAPLLCPEDRCFGAAAHLKGRLVRKYRLLGLTLFVAVPLPGTGAWTGALVAAFLHIRLRHALPAIALGVLVAGVLVTLMTIGVIHLF